MVKLNIYIYANASSQLGFGHVIRQNTLATEFIARGHSVTLVHIHLPQKLKLSLTPRLKIKKVEKFENITQLSKPDILIVDDYYLSDSHWELIAKLDCKVAFFYDGVGAGNEIIDTVIDMSGVYASLPLAKNYLCGTKYRLIRNDIIKSKRPRATKRDGFIVNLLLGANDAKNLTQELCRLLNTHNEVTNINIITTLDEKAVISRLSGARVETSKIQIKSNISNLGEVMQKCNVAVCAAGGALYELIYLEVPTIALVVAQNQKSILLSDELPESCKVLDVSEGLDKAKFANVISSFFSSDIESNLIAEQTNNLIDGLGAKRICDSLCTKI